MKLKLKLVGNYNQFCFQNTEIRLNNLLVELKGDRVPFANPLKLCHRRAFKYTHTKSSAMPPDRVGVKQRETMAPRLSSVSAEQMVPSKAPLGREEYTQTDVKGSLILTAGPWRAPSLGEK